MHTHLSQACITTTPVSIWHFIICPHTFSQDFYANTPPTSHTLPPHLSACRVSVWTGEYSEVLWVAGRESAFVSAVECTWAIARTWSNLSWAVPCHLHTHIPPVTSLGTSHTHLSTTQMQPSSATTISILRDFSSLVCMYNILWVFLKYDSMSGPK